MRTSCSFKSEKWYQFAKLDCSEYVDQVTLTHVFLKLNPFLEFRQEPRLICRVHATVWRRHCCVVRDQCLRGGLVINASIKSMFVGRFEQSDYVKTIVVPTRRTRNNKSQCPCVHPMSIHRSALRLAFVRRRSRSCPRTPIVKMVAKRTQKSAQTAATSGALEQCQTSLNVDSASNHVKTGELSCCRQRL